MRLDIIGSVQQHSTNSIQDACLIKQPAIYGGDYYIIMLLMLDRCIIRV